MESEKIFYYLVLGWNKNSKEIVEPIIKKGIFYMLVCPKDKEIEYLPCYCSLNKNKIEYMYNRVWPLFKEGKVKKDDQIIKHMNELCILTERNVKEKWNMEKMEEEGI